MTLLALMAALMVVSVVVPAQAKGGNQERDVRFATFNASLNRSNLGELIEDLSTPADEQAQAVAEIIQRTRPDVLLINEFDYDSAGTTMALFQENYLSVSQNGARPIYYPHTFAAESNTGIQSGRDLDKDGVIGGPGDAFGFGFFPGQFGMAVFSRYDIKEQQIRTFQDFLWKDMPGALLPVDPATGESFYDAGDLEIFRLSSKSHWDIPIQVGRRTVHFLTSHPTPPVFDGPEDRNGTRNSDEIRFWADYIRGGKHSRYIYDDYGRRGGLWPGALFVIAGDQNADPFDGDSIPGAAQQLLESPKVNIKITPASAGGVEAADQGPPNDTHLGDPAFDTADFSEAAFGGPGNLRADYVLPSRSLKMLDAGVFWPTSDDPYFYLTGPGFPPVSSDHRLVWIDITKGGSPRR
jgi:3-phytase/alkaline phosphatase D